MAADDLRTEYHLTPDGWVKGTRRYFGNVDGDEITRPKNAVEGWEQHIYQSSIYSDEKVTEAILWHDDSVPDDRRYEGPLVTRGVLRSSPG